MKERLDVILVRQGFAASREKAKALLMAGNVFVDNQREDKAGTLFDESKIKIEVKGKPLPYVSRGGLKLERAVGQFPIILREKVCMEKTNFRYVTDEDIREPIDFASVDVSFISLTKILIPARKLLRSGGEMVCLIKPQCEAGRDKVGKKGVVRERKVHIEVVRRIVDYADMIGFSVKGLTYSPIKGPEGNIEYLLWLEKRAEIPEGILGMSEKEAIDALLALSEAGGGVSREEGQAARIEKLVEEAHGALDEAK